MPGKNCGSQEGNDKPGYGYDVWTDGNSAGIRFKRLVEKVSEFRTDQDGTVTFPAGSE